MQEDNFSFLINKMSTIGIATATKTVTITSVAILSVNVTLGVSALITVVLMCDGNAIQQQQIVMEGSDYTGWGSDDSYVNAFVLRVLGFTAS